MMENPLGLRVFCSQWSAPRKTRVLGSAHPPRATTSQGSSERSFQVYQTSRLRVSDTPFNFQLTGSGKEVGSQISRSRKCLERGF